jgi:entericidin B
MRFAIVAKLALAALLLGAAGTLASCNTIGGFGEDVSAAGNAVTKSSETTQKKM